MREFKNTSRSTRPPFILSLSKGVSGTGLYACPLVWFDRLTTNGKGVVNMVGGSHGADVQGPA